MLNNYHQDTCFNWSTLGTHGAQQEEWVDKGWWWGGPAKQEK